MKAVIFYVEDHIEEITLFRYFLKKYADEVDLVTFENGPIFLKYLDNNQDELIKMQRKRKYCILLDIDLPYINGIDLLKKIKQLEGPASKIPVIMYSSSRRKHHKEESLNAGAAYFLEKPFDYDGMAENLDFLYHNYLATQNLTH